MKYAHRLHAFCCALPGLLSVMLLSSALGGEAVSLQLSWRHGFQFAGYYMAEARGYYRDAGLDVTLLAGTPGTAPVESLMSGQANFAVAGSSILLERAAGKPVVVLGAIFQHSPYVIISAGGTPSQNIHDMAGKRIMIESPAEELRAYLQREGIQSGDFKMLPHTLTLDPLLRGRVDAMSAFMTNEPFLLDQAGFKYQIYTPRAAGIDFYGDTLVTTEHELQSHAARTRAFLAASLQGWVYAMAHPEEAIDLIARQYPASLSRQHLIYQAGQMKGLIQAEQVAIGSMNPGRWRHIADTYAEIGLLPKHFPLAGFLYEPNPEVDLRPFYLLCALLLAGIALVSAVAVYTTRVNQRLRHSEQALMATLEAIPDLLFEMDEHGTYLQVRASRHLLRVLPEAELIGRRVSEVMPAEAAQTVLDALAQAASTGSDYGRVISLPLAGGLSWFELSVSRKMADLVGTPSFIVLSRDITARQIAEQQREESAELLHSAIATIGEAFVVYDADDRLAFFNEEYRQAYRISAPCIEVGRSFEEIVRYGIARGQYPEAADDPQGWLAERLARHAQGDFEQIQRVDNGRWLRIKERKTPSGHTVGFRVDISELMRAKQAAEAASLAKSEFLATVSHEIRTPMNSILGMAQILVTPHLSEAQRQDYARTILSAGQSLLSLLNDMLDLARVESGKFALESLAVAISPLLDEVRSQFAGQAQSKALRFAATWNGPAGQRYLTDPYRLRQMLVNLLNNAFKFTALGFVRLEAREIERDEEHAVLEFSVADSGIGIPKEKQGLLFRPFAQADSSTTRQYGGTGLGLSIVRSLAQSMGGGVGLESEIGQGARLWFRIRAELANSALDSPFSDDAQSAQVGRDTFPVMAGRVLVVEDKPAERKMVEALLSKLGLTVSLAEDGLLGFEAITRGEPFDLVLMDCQMPRLNGLAATEKIRQWETDHGWPRLPIVALTADAFDEDRHQCTRVGMDDFIAKPIALNTLLSVLERWLPVARLTPGTVTVPRPDKELDKARIVAVLDAMQPLLAARQFAALVRCQELQSLLEGSALAGEAEAIAEHLNAFDFNLASERLQRLASLKPLKEPA